MSWIRTAALVAALGLLSAASVGQESATPPPTTPPSSTTTPPPATAGQSPAAPRPPVKDDAFIPTEELSADEQVTFPVDI